MRLSRLTFRLGLAAIGLFSAGVTAQEPPPGGDDFGPPPEKSSARREMAERMGPKERDSMEEMMLLDKFLSLPPEKLAKIRGIIQKIEDMSEAEKEELRARVRKYREMAEEDRRRMRQHVYRVPPEDRALLRHYIFSLSEEEREAERVRLAEMSPEARQAHYDAVIAKVRAEMQQRIENGEPPMPPPPPGRGDKGGPSRGDSEFAPDGEGRKFWREKRDGDRDPRMPRNGGPDKRSRGDAEKVDDDPADSGDQPE